MSVDGLIVITTDAQGSDAVLDLGRDDAASQRLLLQDADLVAAVAHALATTVEARMPDGVQCGRSGSRLRGSVSIAAAVLVLSAYLVLPLCLLVQPALVSPVNAIAFSLSVVTLVGALVLLVLHATAAPLHVRKTLAGVLHATAAPLHVRKALAGVLVLLVVHATAAPLKVPKLSPNRRKARADLYLSAPARERRSGFFVSNVG